MPVLIPIFNFLSCFFSTIGSFIIKKAIPYVGMKLLIIIVDEFHNAWKEWRKV